MEIQKEIRKSCKNCRYYSQHFSKQGTRIEHVFCGHCLHNEVKNYKRIPLELCEFWEDIEIK